MGTSFRSPRRRAFGAGCITLAVLLLSVLPAALLTAPAGALPLRGASPPESEAHRAGGAPALLTEWGSWGSGPKQFLRPWGIAVGRSDGKNVVYVSDYGSHRVQVFDADGRYLSEFGKDELGRPSRLAVDHFGGEIYVLDRAGECVRVFTRQGALQRSWGSAGSRDDQFDAPTGIAVDTDHHVYVADNGKNVVQVFDADGRAITRWGGQGLGREQFQALADVDVYSFVHPDRQDHVFTVDGPPNDRVTEFSSTGKVLNQWGRSGSAAGQLSWPAAVAVDMWGLTYVCDSGNARIQVFAPDGSFLRQWQVVDVGTITDLAVDVDGNIYVLDDGKLRVRKYGPLPDEEPPSTTVKGVDDKWHNKDVKLTYEARDDVVVERTETRILLNELFDVWTDWQEGDAFTIFAMADHSEDGARRVQFRSVDVARHEETPHEVTVRIDTKAPEAKVLPLKPSAVQKGVKVVVNIRVVEALSEKIRFDLGVYSEKMDKLVLKKKTGWVKTKRTQPHTWTFTAALAPGEYSVWVAATDLAGNEGEADSTTLTVK